MVISPGYAVFLSEIAMRLECLMPRRLQAWKRNRPEDCTQATYRPRPPELGYLLRLVGLF
jgi:hypothetical protein